MEIGGFVKKVENGGCFFVELKWTFPQRRMHYLQYHYFLNFTFILLIWGVRTHPPPPAYGPSLDYNWTETFFPHKLAFSTAVLVLIVFF